MKSRWGVHVCTCEGRLPVDAATMAPLGSFVDIGHHPDTSAAPVTLKAREAGLDSLLIACCQGVEPFRASAREAQFHADIIAINHRARCFEPTTDPVIANNKALRLLRGELRAAPFREAAEEIPIRIGKRVVLFTDLPAGAVLAESLSEQVTLTLVVDPTLQLPKDFPARRATRGRFAGISGRLGNFSTQIATDNGGGGQTLASDQVVLLLKQLPAIQGRTGLHVLANPSADRIAALPGALQDLTGDFMKPVAVRYDAAVCAGGAASKEACGACIPVCPYQAISRATDNPLRIAVDHLACEACGACTAACPTSALSFTEPAVGELLGRVAGALGPVAGEAIGTQGTSLGIVFHCSRQGRDTLDSAGARKLAIAGGILPVEVPCLRHVSDALLLATFRMGAAGVAVMGCETCPHGERQLLHRNMDVAERVVTAAGVGAGRMKLVPVHDGMAQPEPALAELNSFAASLMPSPIRFDADRAHPAAHHELVADTIRTFIGQLGAKAAPVLMPLGARYARAAVRAEGCTLCRSCANVCPSHAFRFDESQQTLEFKQSACVACGLCEQVCPEHVITLHSEIALTEPALEYQVLVKDEQVKCAKCGKAYINKKALDAIQAKVGAVPALAGVFGGSRANLLRMCPDCRAISAMLDVRDGWQP